jgi:hypothetical protein
MERETGAGRIRTFAGRALSPETADQIEKGVARRGAARTKGYARRDNSRQIRTVDPPNHLVQKNASGRGGLEFGSVSTH